MSEQLPPIIDIVREGGVGVFPAKNGYMLVGAGSMARYGQTSDRIRQIKAKTRFAPLVRVATPGFIFGMVEDFAPDSLPLVEQHLGERVIWSVTTDRYPEESHTIPEIGMTPVHNPWESQVVQDLGSAIIASSANLTSQSTPQRIEDVHDAILAQADFVLDVGPLPPEPDYGVLHIPDLMIYRDSAVVKRIVAEAAA